MFYAHCNHRRNAPTTRQMRGRAGRAVSVMEQSYGVCPSRASLSITVHPSPRTLRITVWPNFLRTE